MFSQRIRDGDVTVFIYESIAAGKYTEVIDYLRLKAQTLPNSRAIQSVLGWCYVALQDFVSAADCYERLTSIQPDNNTYWLHYAQCLNKAGFPSEAMKIINFIAARNDPETVAILKASVRFQEQESRECKTVLEKCSQKNPIVLRSHGCASFQAKEYAEAAAKFSQALAITGFQPSLTYALAVANFEMGDFRQTAKLLNEIISKALSNDPSLAPPFQTSMETTRVFRNTPALQDSCLIEAYNLKAAMEYRMMSYEAARAVMGNIPPRNEEEVDMITLHNKAILDAENNPEEGIEILTHIVSQPAYPKETLANLVIMYFREELFDVAADFMAENIELCFTQLPEDTYNLFEAVIIEQTAPEEAYVRFEELIVRYQEQLRKLGNQEKARRKDGSTEKLKVTEAEYDQTVDKLMPVVMSQALMYWEHKNYIQVEKQLKRMHEFLADQQLWRTNMGHALFMLENYVEASKFYETVVRTQTTDLLKLSPVLLANLCVSYVMTSRNDEAEAVLKRVEEAEERQSRDLESNGGSSTRENNSSHLCLINLVIGTLYCSKGNFQFGLSRILRSFEPSVAQKLDKTTWLYAKRMLLALIYKLNHHEVALSTTNLVECVDFLTQCEEAGRTIPLLTTGNRGAPTKSFIGAEARLLKRLYLKYSHF